MAYDTDLAERVREHISTERGLDEKPMFGGLAFLLNGNMAVCVSGKGGLMVRVPPSETDELLAEDHVEPMIMAGRQTRGWVRVSADGVTGDAALRDWVGRGVAYATSLPAK
ncbi:MAG: TfoX/Sxy family protein [Mycobacterium kyogaense]|uniref:TfoX/Sxy family protein n=1 Tax=Mycobacterium kyogaense TaxID=2212479 RepID=UPI002FF6BD17